MLITLEGIEGSGKTTQVGHLVDFLEGLGYGCLVTREPGGTAIGKKIRGILLDPANSRLDPLAELLLYAADRAQHIREKLIPALSAGKIVICDRFFDATTVYQGYARGLDKKIIHQLHRIVLGNLIPDLTVLFDLSPEVGLRRAGKALAQGDRVASESRFENEALAFHRLVRNGYLDLASSNADRFRIIDAGLDELGVREQIIEAVSAVLTDR